MKEEAGDFAKFESLLAKTQPEQLTVGLIDGRTLLHIISSSGYTKYAHLLITAAIKKGVLTDMLDSREPQDNQTPLFFAIRSAPNGFPEIITLLIKNGCNVNLRDKKGRSAVHYASEQGQDDTLQLLIQSGADVNFQDFESKETPLHVAILNGQFNAVSILCEEGKARIDLVDKNGDTLLHYAAVTQGNASLYIRYLIEKQKVSAFVKNTVGQTPRQLAEAKDIAKYHRVIKNLRKYEQQELAKRKPEIVERRVTVYQYEKTFQTQLMNSSGLSVGIAVALGFVLYLLSQ